MVGPGTSQAYQMAAKDSPQKKKKDGSKGSLLSRLANKLWLKVLFADLL